MEINTGIPQGSPISPILFLIYIADLFPRLEEKFNCQTVSFADDVTVLVKNKDPRVAAKTAEDIARDMIEWGKENEVAFDTDKTEFFYLTRKRRSNTENISIRIDGAEFKPNKKATRILGVWIDSGLTFREHWNTMKLKGSRALNRLRDLTKTWGLQIGNCKKVMIACVQSIVLYGAEVWWNEQKNREEELQKILNDMGRCITGAWRTTPTRAVIREAGLREARALLNNRQRRAAERTATLPEDNPVRRIVAPEGEVRREEDSEESDIEYTEGYKEKRKTLSTRYRTKLLREGIEGEIENQTLRTSGLNPHETIVLSLDKKEKETRDKVQSLIESISDERTIQIYTDGTRQENGTVAAAWVRTTEGEREKGWNLGKNMEVFDAECIAIARALESVKKEENRNIVIGVDSQAAINRMRHRGTGPAQSSAISFGDTARELTKKGCKITIVWTPSHIGIPGNEKADRAAENAAKQEAKKGPGWMSIANIRRKVNEAKKRDTIRGLEGLTGGKDYVESRRPYMGSKREGSRMIQLRTGHFLHRTYQMKRGKEVEDRCTFCGTESQTRDHLMTRCKSLKRQNDTMLRRTGLNRQKRGYGLLHRNDKAGMKRINSRMILERAKDKDIIEWQKKTGVGYRMKPKIGEG
jgi:ribonuclease HI